MTAAGSTAAARSAAGALAVAAALALGGCSAGSSDAGPASPGATASPDATPTAAPSPTASPQDDDTWRSTLASGHVAVEVAVPRTGSQPNVAPGPDDVATLTIDPADAAPDAPVVLTLGQGSFTPTSDGGLSVLDASGTVVGGIAAPGGGARLAVADATRATLTLPPPDPATTAPPSPVTLTLGTRGLVSAHWGDREGGRSLFVDPTPWARAAGPAGWALTWAEVVAEHPDADTPGMHDQLVCHGIGAPDKTTWNLEPWRPDVGLVAVLAARCNPTR